MEEKIHSRQPMRSATMADVLDIVSRSHRSLVVVRLPETTIAAINAPALEQFGESEAALVGRRASSLFHGADAVYASVALSSLASGAVDGYSARRRLVSRQVTEAWTCVRSIAVDGGLIALGMTVPAVEPRPVDAVERELASATDIEWVSAPRAGGVHGSRSALTPTAETVGTVLDRLSHRQREIVAAMLLGERTTNIAAALFVSTSTVRSHLSAIFDAFSVRSQTELLGLLRPKWVSPDENGPLGK